MQAPAVRIRVTEGSVSFTRGYTQDSISKVQLVKLIHKLNEQIL
jgi:hypothetical protein